MKYIQSKNQVWMLFSECKDNFFKKSIVLTKKQQIPKILTL
jgi:hypothetical protein